jgi:UDP-3-O-[3-hydroxymyristoyl] N-acetylglucosamine deacetylase/3-hydroxyacyl-[acyl-carrier-protein] dehydratase
MNVKQKTIKAPVSVSGTGLHTGESVIMTFNPAPENHGYKFRRIDMPGAPIIDADVDNVTDTSRGTTISQNGASVSTVEHVLAALVGLELDNVLIDLNGPETPIMDGSSERKVDMVAMPLDDYRFTCMVDYNSQVLGSQHASISTISEFNKEIASCRTFCFLHELEALLQHDLIKGGDLNNAIVVVDKEVDDEELAHLAKIFNRKDIKVAPQGILNNIELRHQNEPARHKLLDMIGDLALVGVPLRGHIMAARPGHAANVAFAKKIKTLIKKERSRKHIKIYDPNAKPVYDTVQIMNILPHRQPFLMIDKILELTKSHVVGLKNVTMNEDLFRGHFPGTPLFPGVLQIEAMAQTGGILVLNTVPDPENYITLFLKIENARFKAPVVPGDTLIFHCNLLAPIRRGIAQMKGIGMVGERVVVEAELMAQIVKRQKTEEA